jgi:hypothetical protein
MIGAPIAGRLHQMLQEKWTPLATIVAADQNSPYYDEKSRAGSLYEEGWALVHMLTLSTSYGGKTKELMGALNSRQPSREALEQIYGKPLAQIDKDLQAYVRSDTFRAALLPARLDKSKEAIPAEPASDFEVELALADLMNRPGKQKENRSGWKNSRMKMQRGRSRGPAWPIWPGGRGGPRRPAKTLIRHIRLGTENRVCCGTTGSSLKAQTRKELRRCSAC